MSVTLSLNLGISYIFGKICLEPLVRTVLISGLHQSRQLRILGDDRFSSTARNSSCVNIGGGANDEACGCCFCHETDVGGDAEVGEPCRRQ